MITDELTFRDWWDTLPPGRWEGGCYQCGHDGVLSGPPFSNRCVDRDGCHTRQTRRRRALGIVPHDAHQANVLACEEHGHVPVAFNYCLRDFPDAMEHLGDNPFVVGTYCERCDTILEQHEVVR